MIEIHYGDAQYEDMHILCIGWDTHLPFTKSKNDIDDHTKAAILIKMLKLDK